MTLALTAFEAVARPIQSPSKKRGVQEVRLTITGANTDTLWDLSAVTAGSLGTFWTAAIADATYGALATAALNDFRTIQAQATGLRLVEGEQLIKRTPLAAGGVSSLLSAASVGGSVTETYVVTGLLSTDTILSVTPKVASATGRAAISVLAGTVGGGAATGNATVTGLLSTDTILAVTQNTKGANSLPLLGYGSPGSNSLPYVYSADPGASGTLKVLISRTATTDTYTPVSYGSPATDALAVVYGADPGAGAKVEVTFYRGASDAAIPSKGQYGIVVNSHLPDLSFASGDAPTSAVIVLKLEVADGVFPIHSTYG